VIRENVYPYLREDGGGRMENTERRSRTEENLSEQLQKEGGGIGVKKVLELPAGSEKENGSPGRF
jgi:hypothetical protein